MINSGRAFWIGAIALLAETPALAVDGGLAAQGASESYYEASASGADLTPSASGTTDAAASGGLPTALYAVEGAGGVSYRELAPGSWQVDIAVAPRPHERVDAIYDLVLAIPLPVGSSSEAWQIVPRDGTSKDAKPIVYSGAQVVLKRNVALERSWLPLLAGAAQGLPDLSRTGYAWTLWDAVVRYDASVGPTVQAYASFRYKADPSIGALDPNDPRSSGYVITWIPTLENVPPFAVRLDVAP
jgi:hypothetical protein